jgi:hypothetical protein
LNLYFQLVGIFAYPRIFQKLKLREVLSKHM